MKTITEISECKRNKKRCNLYLDGEFFCAMELITVMQNRLRVGLKIAEEELRRILIESEDEAAWQSALKYVSSGVHTESQVKDYLKRKGYLPEAAERAVEKLVKYGFVDDGFYSKNYVDARKTVKGKRLLKLELKAKGVSEKVIDEALESAPDEEEGAYLTAVRFMKNKEVCFENLTKCYRRLISKGFDFDVAKNVIDRIKSEDGNSEN